MSLFYYKAKDKQGKTVTGNIEAINKDVASDLLMEQGLLIIDLKKKSRISFFEKLLNIFNKVKTNDLVFFMQQLSVLISAEIPIVQALRILEKQTKNNFLKKVILEVADDVESGEKLSVAFSRHPNVFNNFFIKMVKSGEVSGRLEEVFSFLAKEQENNYLLVRKVKGALIYPSFILSVLIVIGTFMVTFVVPKIAEMFKNADAYDKLPFLTLFLINFAYFFQRYWWVVILVLAIFFYIFYLYKKTPNGERQIDSFVLNMPLFGKLMRKFYLTRFTRSFYTLIIGGVDVTSALKGAAEVVDNVLYKDLLKKVIKEVEDGNSVSSAFQKSKLVPPMYYQMIGVGEKTGKLVQVLQKITDFYTSEIEDTIHNMLSLFEPLVIIFIAFGVGFLIFAIIMPMYNLSSTF